MNDSYETSSKSILTFIHRFSPRVQCTMRVSDEPAELGSSLNLMFEWSGQPQRKHLPTYRRWILVTVRTLADRWGATIFYGLGVAADATELWIFEPGKPPRLIEKLNAGIP